MVNPYARISMMSKNIKKYKRLLKEKELTYEQKKLLYRIIGEYYYDTVNDEERIILNQIKEKLTLQTVENRKK